MSESACCPQALCFRSFCCIAGSGGGRGAGVMLPPAQQTGAPGPMTGSLEGQVASQSQSHSLACGCHTMSRAILTGGFCFHGLGRPRSHSPVQPEMKEGGRNNTSLPESKSVPPLWWSTGSQGQTRNCASQGVTKHRAFVFHLQAGRRPKEFTRGPGQKVDRRRIKRRLQKGKILRTGKSHHDCLVLSHLIP